MDVKALIANTTLFTDGEPYVMLALPPAAITVAAGIVAEISDPFTVLVVDKDEVTLVVPHEAIEEFAARLRGQVVSETRFRLITFDVALPHTVVGYLAVICAALAEAQIPVFPYSAFTRDHILVPEALLDKAIQVLERLKQG